MNGLKKKSARGAQPGFQSLEKLFGKFPMIGNSGAAFSNDWKFILGIFQPLETFAEHFPMIGKCVFSLIFGLGLLLLGGMEAEGAAQTNLLASDSFDYTSSQALNGLNGGWQWSDAWASASFAVQNGSFSSLSGYPTNSGNKVKISPASGTSEEAVRHFTAVTSGAAYVACFINYESSGAGNWMGVSLMSNSSARAFFGEIADADETLGLAEYDDGGSYSASSYTLEAGSGKNYLLVAAYDFDSRVLKTKAFTDSVPGPEPVSWDTEVTLAVGRMNELDGVRLEAGGSSSSPGNCYFDEVRIAASWADLVDRLETIATRKAVPVFVLRGLR